MRARAPACLSRAARARATAAPARASATTARARGTRPTGIDRAMLQQLLYVVLTVLILGLTLYVLLENSRKQDAKLRKRLRSGGAS